MVVAVSSAVCCHGGAAATPSGLRQSKHVLDTHDTTTRVCTSHMERLLLRRSCLPNANGSGHGRHVRLQVTTVNTSRAAVGPVIQNRLTTGNCAGPQRRILSILNRLTRRHGFIRGGEPLRTKFWSKTMFRWLEAMMDGVITPLEERHW